MRLMLVAFLGVVLMGAGAATRPATTQTATKPAATQAADPPTLKQVIEKMPAELRWSKGEAQTRTKARNEWLLQNVCWDGDERKAKTKEATKCTTVKIEGLLAHVSEDKNRPDIIFVSILVGPFDGLDGSQYAVAVELPAAKYKKETMSWNDLDTVCVSGELTMLMPASNKWGRMKSATVISHTPKPVTTKPAKR